MANLLPTNSHPDLLLEDLEDLLADLDLDLEEAEERLTDRLKDRERERERLRELLDLLEAERSKGCKL